jgi:hypothetical protein
MVQLSIAVKKMVYAIEGKAFAKSVGVIKRGHGNI